MIDPKALLVDRLQAEASKRRGNLYDEDAYLVDLFEEAATALEAGPAGMKEAAAQVAEAPIFYDYVSGSFDGPWQPGSPYDRGQLDRATKIAAAIRALPLPPAAPGSSPVIPEGSSCSEIPKRWRHKKRGSTYIEVGRPQLQSAWHVHEGDRLVIYRCEGDGTLWARPEPEFMDGRFEPLAAEPASRVSSSGWEPIETASIEPGRHFDEVVLIGAVRWNEGKSSHVGPIKWQVDRWEFDSLDYDVFLLPTHWQPWPAPLPAPPEPEAT